MGLLSFLLITILLVIVIYLASLVTYHTIRSEYFEKIQKITIIFIAWLVPIVGPIIILAVLNEDKVIIKYRPGIPLLDYIFLSAVFVQEIGQSDGVIDFGDIGGGGGGGGDGDGD